MRAESSTVRMLARRLPSLVAGLSLPLIYVAAFGTGPHREDVTRAVLPAALEDTFAAAPAGAFPEMGKARPASIDTLTLSVRRGDTLELLFRRAGLDLNDLAVILQQEPARRSLHLLKPGDQVEVQTNGPNVVQLNRDIDISSRLVVRRVGDGYAAQVVPLSFETQRVESQGRIESSLFQAGADARISDAAIMKLAAIFASEIDFVLDIREGDEFTVLYDQFWRDGKQVGEGEIIAAEFLNQGVRYRAVRYQSPDGRADYYTPEGRSLRKAFVRAPLAFSRVSSGFNPHRMHPILHTIRAHTGTDYAAPTGTPVHAPGDGRVAFRGRKGGYGNVVILQHPGNVSTVYGHLSAFARTTREGRHVAQGDVIGFVGMTGLATAPHLHYEYRINGVPVNSRTVKLPDAQPVNSAYRADFMRASAPLLQRLDVRASMFAAGRVEPRPNG